MALDILSIFAAPAVSGLFGAIGGIVNKHLELKAIKEQNTHEREMLTANTEATIKLAQVDMQKTDLQGSWNERLEEMKAFAQSQKSTSKWSEISKSFIRPLILLLLGYMCMHVMIATDAIVDKHNVLKSEEIIELYRVIVLSVFSLFSMGVGWYFGQRTSKITDKFMGIVK